MTEFAKGTDRVRSVQNELVVAPPSELGSRSNDTYITSVVKTRFLEATDKFSATHVKVVTDRGVVYLMGLVRRAGDRRRRADRRHDHGGRARGQGRSSPSTDVNVVRMSFPTPGHALQGRRDGRSARPHRSACRARSCSRTACSTSCIAAT